MTAKWWAPLVGIAATVALMVVGVYLTLVP
jgi:hypothetical protein